MILGIMMGLMFGGAGCEHPINPNKLSDAEAALQSGLDAIEKQDWATADSELSAALSGAGLQPDLYEQAMLARAKARLNAGNLDGAVADLVILEQGAAAMDQVLSVKGDLALRRNDKTAAIVAYQAAKKLNPKIVIPAQIQSVK